MEKYRTKEYKLTFTGDDKKNVSFKLSPNDINKKTESTNDNIIYIVSNSESILYVGEAKNSIKKRLSSGFTVYRSVSRGNKPRDGYKGYQWIDLFKKEKTTIYITVFLLDKLSTEKANKNFRESVEGELCWLFREQKEWPTHQNEIHFHNNSQARELALEIFEKMFEKN